VKLRSEPRFGTCDPRGTQPNQVRRAA